ncbi:LuxR family transcriptional regulator [Streptomyces sp. NPDC088923]|uniref:LuxR family transcriptional regulator n=1 Tax=Streptomyces sp. NPDC088923 TaxID=3365913 RepID=UPI0038151599
MGDQSDKTILGLSDEAQAVYERALRDGELPPDAEEETGVAELVGAGLLKASGASRNLYPVDPRLVEVRLTSGWRAKAWQLELRATEVEHELAPLVEMFTARKQRAPDPLEYIHGLAQIREFVQWVSREASEEILTAQPGGGRSAAVLKDALPLAVEQLRRGVRMQTLYLHSARFSEPTKKYVAAVTESGGEVRTLEEFFERLFVIDRCVAILPSGPDRTAAVVVHDKALVRFLADVFDRNWQRALPFAPATAAKASTEVMPKIHQMIKRLLVQGLPDSAIARRIGISERSYHSHLARIRAGLGAGTRLQLGYLLAKEQLDQGVGETNPPAEPGA